MFSKSISFSTVVQGSNIIASDILDVTLKFGSQIRKVDKHNEQQHKYKGILLLKLKNIGKIADRNVKKYVLSTQDLQGLNDHAPLITTLDIRVLRIKTNDSWEPIILLGGFAEINNNNVIVLVNGVEKIKKGDVTAPFNEVEDA